MNRGRYWTAVDIYRTPHPRRMRYRPPIDRPSATPHAVSARLQGFPRESFWISAKTPGVASARHTTSVASSVTRRPLAEIAQASWRSWDGRCSPESLVFCRYRSPCSRVAALPAYARPGEFYHRSSVVRQEYYRQGQPISAGRGGSRDVCKLQRRCVGCRVCRQYDARARESSSSQGDKLAEL